MPPEKLSGRWMELFRSVKTSSVQNFSHFWQLPCGVSFGAALRAWESERGGAGLAKHTPKEVRRCKARDVLASRLVYSALVQK